MLVRLTRELNEDCAALFLLLSTISHIGVNQEGINNYKEDDDEYAVADDFMSHSQDPVRRRSMQTNKSLMRRMRRWRRPGMN